MKSKIWSLCLALALCLSLMPVTALAAEWWEHSVDDHSSWTALTSDELSERNYSLLSGKYYLSGNDTSFLSLSQTITIPDNANVILCLHDVNCVPEKPEAAIKVEAGATLNICDCSPNGDACLGGSIGGTGPAIENHGILNIVSGNIGGIESITGDYLAVDNRAGAVLNLGGSPALFKITSAGTISATCGSIPYTGSYFESYCFPLSIEYTGDHGKPVVTNVSSDNYEFFQTPDGDVFSYDADNGTLTMETSVTYGSLVFAGSQTVEAGVYYKINYREETDHNWGTEYYAVWLSKSDESNYNLFWDESNKTLTLRDTKVISSVIGFQNSAKSLFSLASGTLTVNLIGKNEITVYSYADNIDRDAYAFESQGGDIVFQGDGSLAVTMWPGATQTGDIDITGIIASGTLDNQADLTISGSPGSLSWSGGMTGISCDSFTNSGTLDIEFSDLSNGTGIVVKGGTFDNSGAVDIQFAETDGVGIFLGENTSGFQNSGSIMVDIPTKGKAHGILRHSSQTEKGFTWTNAAKGQITISVSGQGATDAAVGGGALAGLDLRSNGEVKFTNNGTLTVTAESEHPASSAASNWPSWQYFDTVGLLLRTGNCTLTNTGTMDLTALKGYTAGICVDAAKTKLSIENRGTMNIMTTTQGGENIRSIGIYAQLPFITDGQVKKLPFTMQGDAIRISTCAADGFTVESDKLMGICLVQTFEDTVPSDLNSLQQIHAEGMALPGKPVVIKVENDGNGHTAFINTIGTVAADETVIPVTDMTALPAITGTVTIGGSTLVGSTLTAQVSNLPFDANVSYQWQVSDSADGPFTNLAGETGMTLLLTDDHVGKYIRLVVTPTDGIYGGTLAAVTYSWVSYPHASDPTYAIQLDIGDHGSVRVSPQWAEKGETVTITVTPDEGYMLKDLTVTDSKGRELDLTDKGDGKYTFKMPGSKVTVTAAFTEIPPESLPFADVPGSAWYYDGVAYVYEHGLMNGTSDTTFSPDITTSRSMIATILWRMAGSPAVDYIMDFADVDPWSWYGEAVRWAASEGVVTGYANGHFGPGDPITREQFAVMLYRFAQAQGYDVSEGEDTNILSYADALDISEYAVPAMQWACGAGIVQGTGSALNPQGQATRAEAAAMLMRFCEAYVTW